MSNKLRNIFFVIGLCFFAFFVHKIGISNIVENLYKVGWWFVPIIALWGFVYALNTMAFQVVLKNERSLSFAELFSITVSGFAINYITPLINLGGEPFKVLSLRDRIGIDKAVSSTVLYSMLHFFSSFVFWILVILLAFVFIPFSFWVNIVLGAFLAVCLLFVLFFRACHKKGVVTSFFALAGRLPFVGKVVNNKTRDKGVLFATIDRQIAHLYLERKKDFFVSLGLEVAARVLASVEFYLILTIIGFEISIIQALFVNAIMSLIMNLLFFLPMELGAREGGLYLAFDMIKYSPALGVFAGIVNRIRELFWIMIGLLLIQLSGRKVSARKTPEVKYEHGDII